MTRVLADRYFGGRRVGGVVSLEHKPEDAWIGLFWRESTEQAGYFVVFDAWLLLLPAYPIHAHLVVRYDHRAVQGIRTALSITGALASSAPLLVLAYLVGRRIGGMMRRGR